MHEATQALRSPGSRRLASAAELLLGAAIVIGHNVFHVVPNEVPILALAGLVSLRLRDGGWSAMGFRRPASWTRIVLIALAAAAVRIGADELVISPLAERLWPARETPDEVTEIVGNLPLALQWLAIVWTFAAFGEETAYRGYLLTRAADVGERTKAAYWIAVVLVSVLFGIGHYWNGPAGMLSSGFAGLVLGSAYMLAGRNLWASILAHGLIDTVFLVAVYLGWNT
jgi:membrane protease YdiL (CAAX protease family)